MLSVFRLVDRLWLLPFFKCVGLEEVVKLPVTSLCFLPLPPSLSEITIEAEERTLLAAILKRRLSSVMGSIQTRDVSGRTIGGLIGGAHNSVVAS